MQDEQGQFDWWDALQWSQRLRGLPLFTKAVYFPANSGAVPLETLRTIAPAARDVLGLLIGENASILRGGGGTVTRGQGPFAQQATAPEGSLEPIRRAAEDLKDHWAREDSLRCETVSHVAEIRESDVVAMGHQADRRRASDTLALARAREFWGEDQDGPKPWGAFCWQGVTSRLTPLVSNVLNFMWDRVSVSDPDFMDAVWGNDVNESNLKKCLSETNKALLAIGCTSRFLKRANFQISWDRQSEVTLP